MGPQLYGVEHILYIVISAVVAAAALLLAKKFAKTEEAKQVFLKCIAALQLASVMANRLTQVFVNDQVLWHYLIPDSICGMTSVLFSLSILFGKKDNGVTHAMWLIGLFGGLSTVAYATFLDYNPTFFCLPTMSGLLHHSFSAMLAVSLFWLKQINITYKKWYWSAIGFMFYVTVGAFLMNTFHMSDAMHIAEPILSGTPFTIWVMAPIYAAVYALILLGFELARKLKKQ